MIEKKIFACSIQDGFFNKLFNYFVCEAGTILETIRTFVSFTSGNIFLNILYIFLVLSLLFKIFQGSFGKGVYSVIMSIFGLFLLEHSGAILDLFLGVLNLPLIIAEMITSKITLGTQSGSIDNVFLYFIKILADSSSGSFLANVKDTLTGDIFITFLLIGINAILIFCIIMVWFIYLLKWAYKVVINFVLVLPFLPFIGFNGMLQPIFRLLKDLIVVFLQPILASIIINICLYIIQSMWIDLANTDRSNLEEIFSGHRQSIQAYYTLILAITCVLMFSIPKFTSILSGEVAAGSNFLKNLMETKVEINHASSAGILVMSSVTSSVTSGASNNNMPRPSSYGGGGGGGGFPMLPGGSSSSPLGGGSNFGALSSNSASALSYSHALPNLQKALPEPQKSLPGPQKALPAPAIPLPHNI